MDKTIKTRVAVYARVSTHEQTAQNQILDLEAFCQVRGWTIKQTFIDEAISGAKDSRPQLDLMMDLIRKHKFDALLVWALDRFARSMKHLVVTLDDLRDMKVDFISYKQNFDTSTSQGRMLFGVIASMAEFERELIRERVKSGLRRVQASGKRLGRPSLPGDVRQRIRDLHAAGHSYSSISKRIIWIRASGKFGPRKEMTISKSVVGKVLKESSIKPMQNVA